MQHSITEQFHTICPPLRWRPLTWLTTSPVAPVDVGDELRASLFNRMESLFSSGVAILVASVAVAVRHPHALYITWAGLDFLTTLVRLAAAAVIIRRRARQPGQAAPGKLLPDIYVFAGLLWCGVLGCGAGLCLASGDLAVSVLGCLLVTTTTGAQCARVPGSPRLLMAQLGIIGVPVTIGGLFAPDAFLNLGMMVVPAYMFAIISINRQLHHDYVELIVGRHESRLMALRCPLTGLANRRAFDRALTTALAAGPHARAIVVLSLDLDGFKIVNDAYGHLAGDLLLRQVAERLVRHVPAGCMTARLGGDEFAILLLGNAATAAEQMACAVLAAIRAPFVLSGNTASVGVSIGLARASGHSTPDRLLGEADQALYAAKRAGKNRFCWSDGKETTTFGPEAEDEADPEVFSATVLTAAAGEGAEQPIALTAA